jgi:hypothetical protein
MARQFPDEKALERPLRVDVAFLSRFSEFEDFKRRPARTTTNQQRREPGPSLS